MPREEGFSTQAVARALPASADGPHWRAVLEARWQAVLREVTELSLAYHAAAGDSAGDAAGDSAGRGAAGRGGAGGEQARRLLCRTIAARRRLADVEEALGRLAAGTFGRCEQCGAPIPAGLLALSPDRRYCPRCVAAAAPAPALAGPPSG
jgi:DnaK suppressor protein